MVSSNEMLYRAKRQDKSILCTQIGCYTHFIYFIISAQFMFSFTVAHVLMHFLVSVEYSKRVHRTVT